MLFNSIVLLAPLFAAVIAESARAPAKERGRLAPQGLDLTKRACSYNGCTCQSGYAGVYCANCVGSDGEYVVIELGSSGSISDVYQCNGSGGCCDYGYASDCANGATGRCG